MPVQKILAIDWGKKSWGLALGLHADMIQPLPAQKASRGWVSQQAIQDLIRTWEPHALVIGLPLNMDGTQQPITRHVLKLSAWLETWLQIPVYLQDERLTTKEARRQLNIKKGADSKKNKEVIDSYAAMLILEAWFLSQDAGE